MTLQGLTFIPMLIKSLRKKHGLSMLQLAEMAEVSKPTIIKIEAGDQRGRLITLERVFRALNYPMWRAFLMEYFDEYYPDFKQAVQDRFRSGKWRLTEEGQEVRGHPEEKLVDHLLRDVDEMLHLQLADLPRLPDQPKDDVSQPTNQWSKAQMAEIVELVTTTLAPDDMPGLVQMIHAVASMKERPKP